MNSPLGRAVTIGLLFVAYAAVLLLGGEGGRQSPSNSAEPAASADELHAQANLLHDLQRTIAEGGTADAEGAAPTTTISVQVLDLGKRGVSGAELSVTSHPDMSARLYRCDADGRTTLRFTPPVDLTIAVFSRTPPPTGYSPARVAQGEGHVELSFTPSAIGVVTGRVLQAGAPVAGAKVGLFHEALFPMSAITDASGWYRFEAVSPGSLAVMAGKPCGTAYSFYSLSLGETAVMDLIVPEIPLVMVLHDPESSAVYEGVKLEIQYESAETGMRSVWNDRTDGDGATSPLFLDPGKVRWRVREGGAASLPGLAGEFDWLPTTMEAEVLLPIHRADRVVELLVDRKDLAAFTPKGVHGFQQVPQDFMLTHENGKEWVQLRRAPQTASSSLAVLTPSQLAGTVTLLNQAGTKMAIGEVLPGSAATLAVQAEVVSVVRLLVFVTRADGILANHFKCVRILDDQGRQWPTGSVWLNHSRRTTNQGEIVVPQEITALPPGTYTVTMDCLTGQTETKQVQIDGVTTAQTVWFCLR